MSRLILRKFAGQARVDLIAGIREKSFILGVEKNKVKPLIKEGDFYLVAGDRSRILSESQKKDRDLYIEAINYNGFDETIEEIAYIWFNRFVSLRYIEANGFLSPDLKDLFYLKGEEKGRGLKKYLSAEFIDDAKELLKLKENEGLEDVYIKVLVIKSKWLEELFPKGFKKITGYMELLLPDNLLDDDFVIGRMIKDLPKDLFVKNIEVLGWLYQYYNWEENDRLIRNKKPYTSDEIPRVTQLFTPSWIVKYMVDNTLGRYLVENNLYDSRGNKDRGLSKLMARWDYYLDNKEGRDRIKSRKNKGSKLKVEEISFFDPAMGNGNILVYAFDFFYQIYLLEGYEPREIPRKILENNLYGLDVDSRVANISNFSLYMKAKEYDDNLINTMGKDFLEKNSTIDLNLIGIEEANKIRPDDLKYIEEKYGGDIIRFINQFNSAKLYGSLLRLEDFNQEKIGRLVEKIKGDKALSQDLKDKLGIFFNQAKIMTGTYDITVTNPPYISRRYMNKDLKEFIDTNYPKYNYDIFASFLSMAFKQTKEEGHIGFMSPYVWMFIFSYEDLRKDLIENKTLTSLVQLEYSSFEGATVPVCSFSLKNKKTDLPGEYIRLSDFKGAKNQPIKLKEAIRNPNLAYRYTRGMDQYKYIPKMPIAYWVSDRIFNIFSKEERLGKYAEPRQGLATGENAEFLRLWTEVDSKDIGFFYEDTETFHRSKKKYAPYNKGGPYRKWYGNFYYLIKFNEENYDILCNQGNKLPSRQYYFKESLTWSFVSSAYFGVRNSPKGFVFDVGGSSIFTSRDKKFYILGLLNSKVGGKFVDILNPTLNLQVGDIRNIPFIYSIDDKDEIERLVKDNIEISKNDWDQEEISWDFKTHPLLNREIQGLRQEKLIGAYKNLENYLNRQFKKLKSNEERLNEIFIKVYGLANEMDKFIDKRQVTIKKLVEDRDDLKDKTPYLVDRQEVMESFLSYIIGCISGRYSLERPGLINTSNKPKDIDYGGFPPSKTNLITIGGPGGEGNIIKGIKDFLAYEFGRENVEENFAFISENLGIKGRYSSEAKINQYFTRRSGFYSYHLRTYKRRPIYWIFNISENYKAIFYIHRYSQSLLSELRSRLEDLIGKSRPGLSRSRLETYMEGVDKLIKEELRLDLDRGVEVNYKKFQNIEIARKGEISRVDLLEKK